MYAPGPNEAELAAIGITAADVVDTSVTEIWPENDLVFRVFSKLGTQWVIGPGGPVGLNYDSALVVMRLMGVKDGKQLEVFDALRMMESEALNQMNKK